MRMCMRNKTSLIDGVFFSSRGDTIEEDRWETAKRKLQKKNTHKSTPHKEASGASAFPAGTRSQPLRRALKGPTHATSACAERALRWASSACPECVARMCALLACPATECLPRFLVQSKKWPTHTQGDDDALRHFLARRAQPRLHYAMMRAHMTRGRRT